MKQLYTLLILYTGFTATAAETKKPVGELLQYDVEIIIFEDAYSRYLNNQTWHENDDDISATEKLVSNNTVTSDMTEFNSISPSILTAKYQRINASSEYNVIFYGAWRQTGLDKENAFKIAINNLENNHTSSTKNHLSGSFKLVLARYLHLYTELSYLRSQTVTHVTDSLDDTDSGNESYLLQSHRRMRSKELHYIDHPLVGILVQINPVKVIKDDHTAILPEQ